MSKILVCIPCLLTGGTEVQTLSLIKALVQARHVVSTVCYFEHDERMVERYKDVGSEVFCLSKDGKRPQGVWTTIRFLWKELKEIVRKTKPDIVHVQYMAPGAIPILIFRALGCKTIIATAHTMADIYSSLKLLHFLQRYILTAFICITLRAEESFFGTSQLFTKDLQLKKRGNHFTIYNCLPEYIHIRDISRTFNHSFTIGVVSRLEYIKGMDMVIPAFETVLSQCPQTKLLIVGDGSLRPMMERQAKGLSNITFLGRQPQEELQELYDKIDILLVPSRSEGFGLTALEGMARGCVVVASNVGGIPEVINDEHLLITDIDSPKIANKIIALSHESQRFIPYTQQMVIHAKNFSREVFAIKIKHLYQKVLSLS